MCKFFSGLINKHGKCYVKNGVTSHSELEQIFKIRDNGEYAKWELTPVNDWKVENWKFLLDEQRTPEWWNDGYIQFCMAAVKECFNGKDWSGSLYLQGTAITALPSGLKVGGSLYLQGTAITALPSGLKFGGSLYLQGTAITKIPPQLAYQIIR